MLNLFNPYKYKGRARRIYCWNGEILRVREKDARALVKEGYAEHNDKLGRLYLTEKEGTVERLGQVMRDVRSQIG